MLTLQQAKALRRREILYHVDRRNSDGSPERWRVNGHPKVWKRNPKRVCVPLKHGLYDFSYLTEDDLYLFCLTEEEALKGEIFSLEVEDEPKEPPPGANWLKEYVDSKKK